MLRQCRRFFKSLKGDRIDILPEDTVEIRKIVYYKSFLIISAPIKLATGAELEFLGTSSACSTSTRNVSSLVFHYRKCLFRFFF